MSIKLNITEHSFTLKRIKEIFAAYRIKQNKKNQENVYMIDRQRNDKKKRKDFELQKRIHYI